MVGGPEVQMASLGGAKRQNETSGSSSVGHNVREGGGADGAHSVESSSSTGLTQRKGGGGTTSDSW